jgi:hypothetical protein
LREISTREIRSVLVSAYGKWVVFMGFSIDALRIEILIARALTQTAIKRRSKRRRNQSPESDLRCKHSQQKSL